MPALLSILSSSRHDQLGAVVRALGRLRDRRAFRPLALLLSAPHVNHGTVIDAIVEISIADPTADELVHDLRLPENLSEHTVRRLAPGGRSFVPALLGIADSSNEATRRAALEVLGTLGDRRAAPALIKALKHSYGGIRRQAAISLGQIGDARAVAPLAKALGDTDRNVHASAA